jgi:hypothetical protein
VIGDVWGIPYTKRFVRVREGVECVGNESLDCSRVGKENNKFNRGYVY